MNCIKKFIKIFKLVRKKHAIEDACEILYSMGQKNGSLQIHINQAKNNLHDAKIELQKIIDHVRHS